MNLNARTQGLESATSIIGALVGDRLTDKYKAVEALADPACRADMPLLRTLLLKSIKEEFYPKREDELDDPEIADTRSWLLGVLARISSGDDEATEFVIKHLHTEHEPNRWARYWSLEGLIRGANPRVAAVARTLSASEGDPLVAMLATAYVGSLKDGKAIRKVRDAIAEPKTQWFALRAVRVVPLPSAVEAVCEIVDKGENRDATYDAIMALGVVPSHWTQADMAAQSLSSCITELRGRPWLDGMRVGAIAGLGKLKSEAVAPTLIDELADDNPAIVREAARSLERILGLNLAVLRIVEAAAKGGITGIDACGRALRWLDREQTAEELGDLMASGSSNQQEVARLLLSEIGGTVAFEKLRARTDAMRQYTDVLEKAEQKIRELFDRSIREAQSGFHITTIMDLVVFGLGVLLLVASAGYTLVFKGDLASWAGVGISGGVGVLGVLYGTLIAKPRRQIRESVDHLMGLKIMFLAYLRRLHQADQAYTRRMLDDRPLSIEEVRWFSEVVGEIMASTMEQQHAHREPRRGKRESASPAAGAEALAEESRQG